MKNLLQQYLFTYITTELKPEITIPSGSLLSNNIAVPKTHMIGGNELFVYRVKKVKNPPEHTIGGSLTEPHTFSVITHEDTIGVPVYKMTVKDNHFSLNPITKEMLSQYDTEVIEDNHLMKELDKVFVSHQGYRGSRIVTKGKRSKRKHIIIKFEWDRNRLKPKNLMRVQTDAGYMVSLSKDILKFVESPYYAGAKKRGLYYEIRLDYRMVAKALGKKAEVK